MSKIHCAWCGEPLGETPYATEPESCGEPECEREVNGMLRAAAAERRQRAEDDDYGRY